MNPVLIINKLERTTGNFIWAFGKPD